MSCKLIQHPLAVIVACLPPFKLLLESRRGSSADRAAGSFDTFPLRHPSAARLQSYQSRVEGGANPPSHRRWTTWIPQSKGFNGESRDPAGLSGMGIHVQHEYVGNVSLFDSTLRLMVGCLGSQESGEKA